jgi:hypothetical protein
VEEVEGWPEMSLFICQNIQQPWDEPMMIEGLFILSFQPAIAYNMVGDIFNRGGVAFAFSDRLSHVILGYGAGQGFNYTNVTKNVYENHVFHIHADKIAYIYDN